MRILITPLALLLSITLVTAWPADARRLPMLPTELSESDRQALRRVVGAEPGQILSMSGMRHLDGDRPLDPIWVTVDVADDELASAVVAGRRLQCRADSQAPSAWSCDDQAPVEMLFVTLPEDCPVRLGEARRTVAMRRDDGPTVAQARGLVEAICRSDELATEAWSQGHRLMSAGKQIDDELFHVMTVSPESSERGFSFLLDEHCDQAGRCRFVVVRRHGWAT